MKLLGWMHRKFLQNSDEQFKNLVIGHSTSDDQHNFIQPNYGAKHLKPGQRDHRVRSSFSGVEAPREDEYYEEESSIAISELFHGFLAIGTLGSDQVTSQPATPTFAISVENITEKESEVTDYDLKLINEELEKVLGADAKDEGRKDSSARNSHVSTGRSSHGSTITVSGKPLLEGEDMSANGNATCPLQGYLFGSAVELSETTKMAKKEIRTSLGELFQREDKGAEKEKESDKSAIKLMKKKLKKKMLHASSKSSVSATGEPIDSAHAETKLYKILHMFHGKVHPENSTTGKPRKSQPSENEKRTDYAGSNNSDLVLPVPNENKHVQAEQAFGKGRNRRNKSQSQSNLSHFALRNSKSFHNKEHWIKSDADYLVLEL